MLVALIALVACTDDPTSKSGWVDDGSPHLEIVSPAEGDSVSSCFDIEVEVFNYSIRSPVGVDANVEGEGHWHIVFDARYFDCEDLVCAAQLTLDAAADVSIVARLARNNHADFEYEGAVVEDTITVAYDGTVCPVAD